MAKQWVSITWPQTLIRKKTTRTFSSCNASNSICFSDTACLIMFNSRPNLSADDVRFVAILVEEDDEGVLVGAIAGAADTAGAAGAGGVVSTALDLPCDFLLPPKPMPGEKNNGNMTPPFFLTTVLSMGASSVGWNGLLLFLSTREDTVLDNMMALFVLFGLVFFVTFDASSLDLF